MAIAKRDASPSHLLFKIQSVSLHNECEDDKYESPEFVAGDYKWRLIIYPNGRGTKSAGDYISVYLAISGTKSLPENWEVNAVFSIFILNQISGNYNHTNGKTRRFFGLKTEWGVENFMSKKDLITPSKGYLFDDCCVFGAEVFVIDNIKVATRCLSLKGAQVPYKHIIKISDFSKLKEKVWHSEEFTAGGYKWKIRLHPNGDLRELGRSLSVYLKYVPLNSEERVKARFSISMKNQLQASDHKERNKLQKYSHWFDASSITWGWRSFILLDKLKAAGSGFIVNDTCVFEIEIAVEAVVQ